MEYTMALYIRLSSEDGNAGESDSVKNQRDLLTDYVSSRPDLSKSSMLYFIDDGWSGTNFERPSVKNMLGQAKKGEIQCIVVKDFSRFGRNYIEVCDYLEKIFPFLGIRFISVNDRYDSKESKNAAIGLETAFKALLHDLYCKELSEKVRQGQRAKAQKGEYRCQIAPFGYKKSETEKNKLAVDEPAATVVRRIFDMALSGLSMTQIAVQLNNERVDTPLAYRRKNGTDKGRGWNVAGETNHWNTGNITRILRDERFTGKLVSGKRWQTKLGGGMSVDLPKKDWIVIPNAHEAIISDEIFQQVQAILQPYKAKSYKGIGRRIFAHKLKCGHCGHSLIYNNTGGINQYYSCLSKKYVSTDLCFTDRITEDSIKEVVLSAVQVEAIKAADALKLSSQKKNDSRNELKSVSARLKSLSVTSDNLKRKKSELFEEYTYGKITKDDFLSAKSELAQQLDETEAQIAEIEHAVVNEKKTDSNTNHYDRLSKFIHADEVTNEILALIDYIMVYNAERMEVRFAFGDELAKGFGQ